MDKPILIDALHITMGGGRGLLDYLLSSLIQRQVVLHLLHDERCSPPKEENIVGRVFVMEDNGNARKKFISYIVTIIQLCSVSVISHRDFSYQTLVSKEYMQESWQSLMAKSSKFHIIL